MTYRFTIPGYLPLRLNVLLRSHWRVRQVAQAEANNLVAAYAHAASAPTATGRRRVSLTFVGGRADPDARLKLILDALAHARLLVDDSQQWCELGVVKNASGKRAVVITLEDLDG